MPLASRSARAIRAEIVPIPLPLTSGAAAELGAGGVFRPFPLRIATRFRFPAVGRFLCLDFPIHSPKP